MTRPDQDPDHESTEHSDAPAEAIEEQAASRDNVADEGVPTDPGHPSG